MKKKVRAGAVTITSLCQANTFFRKEAASGNKLHQKEKLEVLRELERQPTRKVEQILLSKSNQPEIHFRETVKQETPKLTELRLLIDEETLNKLNRFKEIHSHEMPNPTLSQIVAKLAEIGLEKLDPSLRAERAFAPHSIRGSPRDLAQRPWALHVRRQQNG